MIRRMLRWLDRLLRRFEPPQPPKPPRDPRAELDYKCPKDVP